ncbi:hypothetical protein BKE38_11045 [Pseudoroseomonas deserti]|uniref:Glycosyl transferase family 1 domain-containing protein n=1 Tax=Teichococcus deserti TaxID=1817963 RepID=A0A1V2H3Y6_9PROT|nr:glycosyltransferase [Pseudoroseomonas deserti]ONG54004.1 hypothetical protein BKE38_11045 [Pseudoroseomonas deserti]
MAVLSTAFVAAGAEVAIQPGDARLGPWQVTAKRSSAELRLSLSATGLSLTSAAEAEVVSLFAEIAVPLEARQAGLQLAVTLRAADRRALRGALDSIALLRLGRRERRIPLASWGGDLFLDDATEELRLSAGLAWPFQDGRHAIELRLRPTVLPVALAAITLDLALQPERPVAAPRPAWPAFGSPTRSATLPLQVAVLSWDVSDNPLGRAHILADMIGRHHGVELLGSEFARPGAGAWAPLQDSPLPLRSFPGGSMPEFLAAAIAFASTVSCDIVYLSKPRLPGMLLALLIAHRLGCPVILDLDDHELAFFGPEATPCGFEALEAPATPAPVAELMKPQGRFWTSLAETLVGSFAHRSVASAALAVRFSGLLVRHARDEARFRPDPVARDAIRAELGLAETDRVILFAGTPRRHKGLDRLIAALAAIDDPRLLLVVVGTVHDRGYQRELAAVEKLRIRFLPDAPFARLPALLRMADGVCLLQDQASPISAFQTPAKLSDALSMGIPLAMTPVPAAMELAAQGLVTLIPDEAALRAWLLAIATAGEDSAAAGRRRDWFEAELSYAVNGARLERGLARALEAPVEWAPEWTQLFRHLNRRFGAALPEAPPAWAARSPRAAPVVRRRRPLDLVCFWKQNDTGIYGRRHDMLLKYLRQNEQVGSIVQFDAPIRVDQLHEQAAGADRPLEHGKLIHDATARRFLELDDEPGMVRRTFVHARDRGTSFLGRSLPRRDDYPAYVAEVVARHCRGPVVGWSWPIAPLFPQVAESLGFDLVVADLIDDQRSMARDAVRAAEAEQAYAAGLASADLAFANCAAVAEAFAAVSPAPIHVVPNACEFYAEAGGRPRELEGIEGPVIGYVGNLRARIDIELLDSILAQRPGWTFVLIGSAHNTTEILRLRRHPNLLLLGPKVYEEALTYMRRFDVAIMPHLRNAVSDRMNPLKLYVYVALGIPVVSSDVANIDELRGRIAVAGDRADFLHQLDAAIARRGFVGPSRPPAAEELWPISWPRRVADMVGLCRQALLG